MELPGYVKYFKMTEKSHMLAPVRLYRLLKQAALPLGVTITTVSTGWQLGLFTENGKILKFI
jgi:hypothetical protein